MPFYFNRNSTIVSENNTEGFLGKLSPKRLGKCTEFCMQLIFHSIMASPCQKEISMTSLMGRTKWFQSTGRTDEVWLKSKWIREKKSSQSIALWISLEWEIRSWKCTSNDYAENFVTVLQERFACVLCLVSEPITIELIILFFLISESLDSESWHEKTIKKWN